MSYRERYLRGGEEQTVWAELVALGPAIYEEPLAGEAQAVTSELLRRASINLVLLIKRLQSLDYRFAHGEKGVRILKRPPILELKELDWQEIVAVEERHCASKQGACAPNPRSAAHLMAL
jgi:hypothetical protein